MTEKSVSDERSLLKRAVSIRFKKSRLKIIIFLKLRETSFSENFYEKERMKIETFHSWNFFFVFISWGL